METEYGGRMQAITNDAAVNETTIDDAVLPTTARTTQVLISWEVVAYIVLFTIAFLLRIADLDVVPMTEVEARTSLQTLQIVAPHTPGVAAAPDSPMQFFLQGVIFSGMGASELSARLGSVLGGMLLVMLPLLFRSFLGRDRVFIVSLLFVASPVIFTITRQADAFIWTGVFALLLVWLVVKWSQEPERAAWPMAAAVAAAGLVLLSHPGGPLLAVILLVAAWGALWWTALNAPEERDEPGNVLFGQVKQHLAALPWQSMAGVAALFVVIVGSVLMLYPSGLGHIGNLLAAALSGLVRPATAGMPFGAGFTALLIYELGFVVLAAIAVAMMLLQRRVGYWQRFLILWTALAVLAGIFYRAATPAYAMWIVLPLAFLAADLVVDFFLNHPITVYWTEGLVETDESGQRFWWVKYVIGLLVFGVLIVISVHLKEIGRGMLSIPLGYTVGDAFSMLREPMMNDFRYSLMFFFITLLFIVISLLLVASIWGNRSMLQALGVGFFIFLIGTNLGGGWQTAVVHASNPAEYWYSMVTNPDAYLLRQTLYEISERETQGEPLLDIVAARGGVLEEDGVVGWLLRDYPNTRYVGSSIEAARSGIILMPDTDVQMLNLGGDYVGQRFVIQQNSLAYTVPPLDWLAWIGQRRLRSDVANEQGVTLWLRQDVYNAIPQEDRQRIGLQ